MNPDFFFFSRFNLLGLNIHRNGLQIVYKRELLLSVLGWPHSMKPVYLSSATLFSYDSELK